jgi:hypothetical protein
MSLAYYDDPIKAYPDAVFTALELERIRDIVGADSITTIQSLAIELTAEQRRATRYDIAVWVNEIGEGTISIKGGSDGIDYSTSRDRNEIRIRVAQRFGFDVPSTGGLFRIPVMAGYECYEDDF